MGYIFLLSSYLFRNWVLENAIFNKLNKKSAFYVQIFTFCRKFQENGQGQISHPDREGRRWSRIGRSSSSPSREYTLHIHNLLINTWKITIFQYPAFSDFYVIKFRTLTARVQGHPTCRELAWPLRKVQRTRIWKEQNYRNLHGRILWLSARAGPLRRPHFILQA